MAKRDSGGKQTNVKAATAPATSATADAMEQRVVAFAEQLGRIVGTVQARAEGWMDRDALNKQIAGVRDGAAELLEQLAGSVTSIAGAAKKSAPRAAVKPSSKGRSGGVVDAPGKKHRAPQPSDRGAKLVTSQAAKMRTATPMAKTNRRRGRA